MGGEPESGELGTSVLHGDSTPSKDKTRLSKALSLVS